MKCQFFRVSGIVLLMLFEIVAQSATCTGIKVNSCDRLSRDIVNKKQCYLYYSCRGHQCYQCHRSIDKSTPNLCAENGQETCVPL